MRLDIRYAGEKDVDIIVDMVVRLKILNEELDPHFRTVDNLEERAREYVRESLKSDNVIVLLAYDIDTNDVIGMIRLEIVDRIFYKPSLKALITDIYVKPKYRRKRVATLLLEKAREEARRRGAGIITAVYPADNVIADMFYEKKGFKTLQVEKYLPL